jgi:hypothetical protein
MIRLSEEVLVFARMAAFGLIVGGVYWFVAYEPAGTVLLLGFGAATAVAAGTIWARSRKTGRGAEGWTTSEELGPIPAPALAPFHIGAGAGIVALGIAISPLLVVTGIVVVVIGARYWLEAAMREAQPGTARDRHDRPHQT